MKRFLGCVFSLQLAVAAPAAAWADCASPVDQGAFNVGALKSELSILAIACSTQESYNAFVMRYRSELVAQDKIVNEWFKKTYGRSAQTHYDQYITLLANEQSNVGQKEGSDFCPRLNVLFTEAMSVPEASLLPQYAAAKNLTPASLVTCAADTAVVSHPAASSRRTARTRK